MLSKADFSFFFFLLIYFFFSLPPEPDQSDYADLGLVEITISERNDIEDILALKDTTREKLLYTVRFKSTKFVTI